MRVVPLASSSKGNSTLIYSNQTIFLIDAGITLTDMLSKFEKLKVDPHQVSAILITHEHSDHIKCAGAFSRKFGAKIYCHIDAYESLITKLGKINPDNVIQFSDIPFTINDFKIQAFKVPHDVPCCVGFNVFLNDKKMSIVTDLGRIDESIVGNLFNSKLVIIEANHDEKMLLNNPKYSVMLKQRILSKYGHLSNITTAKVICELAMNNVTQVVLAHLSEENNTPELCYGTVCNYLIANGIEPNINIKIDIAKAHSIGPIFYLK